MPISKENRVRVEFFSKMTATPRGPSSGRRLNRRRLEFGGQRQDLGLLGRASGRRRAGSVGASRVLPRRRDGGVEDGGQRGDEGLDLRVGDDQRRRQPDDVGRGGIDEEPGVAGGESRRPCRAVRSARRRSSRPRPRTWSTSGCPSASMPWLNVLPSTSARLMRSSSASVFSTASAAAVQTGLPPNVLPCRPGVSRSAASPMARHAPIGSPPPSPFASVTISGVMPSRWCA